MAKTTHREASSWLVWIGIIVLSVSIGFAIGPAWGAALFGGFCFIIGVIGVAVFK